MTNPIGEKKGTGVFSESNSISAVKKKDSRPLFLPPTQQLRQMTNWELFVGGRAHDIALETIGYGIVAIPPTAYWAYQQVFGGDNE